MLDGYLKIKTKIDNKEVDKGISELENKIKKLQVQNADVETEKSSLQKEIDNYEELSNKAEKYRQKIKQLKQERKDFSKQYGGNIPSSQIGNYTAFNTRIQDMKQKYVEAVAEIDKQAPKMDKIYAKLEKIKNKQAENNEKISEFKTKIESINATKLQNSIDSIGKGIKKQIGSIGKMAMAVVGIRTAWNLVRSCINTVAQYNPQIATDIAYIQYVLASIMLPVVQRLVSLAYTLLSYINAIMSAWFKINIFGNSSVTQFNKMRNGATGTVKAVKEIQKSLQGFDEMNVLQDNSSKDNSGGTGIITPSMDLNSLQGEVPEWMKWIVDNKGLILSVLAGIAGGILAIKFGLGGIKSLGIGILITGIVKLILDLQNYLQDPSWKNFGNIIQDIGVVVVGLAVIIGSLPVAVVGAIIIIWGTIVKYWEQIKDFIQSGINWLTEKSDWVHQMFGDTIGAMYDTWVSGLQDILNWLDSTMKRIKSNFDAIISFVKNVFTGNWRGAWEDVKKIFSNIWGSIVDTVRLMANLIGKIAINIGRSVGGTIASTFKAIVNGVMSAIENTLNSPIRAVNALIGTVNSLPGISLNRINTFSLPRLARGGIITQPTQAIIGEAGKEAVMPLENNLEWLDILADKLANRIETNGGSYIIQLDGRTIQRGTAKRKQQLAFATNGR